jgi:pimeloyl-ACP methyl ester carboxylesterase
MFRARTLLRLIATAPLLTAGCLSDGTATPGAAGAPDAAPAQGGDPTTNTRNQDSAVDITYRDDLSQHPGCTTAGLGSRVAIDGTPASYTPASLPGFNCAAKEYTPPANEDTSKAIVLLVHGNSSTPLDWETFSGDPNKTPMISETLLADGYHVYAADFRYDMVGDPSDMNTGNPAKNFDHGWATPILEGTLAALFQKYPNRKINVAGFSLGTTIIRDALRRLLRNGANPFAHVHSILLASGANHGVSTWAYCNDENNPANKTMRGMVVCQLGNRDNFMATPFLEPLNGDGGSFETPCADGNTAYGQSGVCGGNHILYTTVVFQDPQNGPLQDEFVSQTSSALSGATNKTVSDVDSTTYFLNGALKHHYGAIRSTQGVQIAQQALEQ